MYCTVFVNTSRTWCMWSRNTYIIINLHPFINFNRCQTFKRFCLIHHFHLQLDFPNFFFFENSACLKHSVDFFWQITFWNVFQFTLQIQYFISHFKTTEWQLSRRVKQITDVFEVTCTWYSSTGSLCVP